MITEFLFPGASIVGFFNRSTTFYSGINLLIIRSSLMATMSIDDYVRKLKHYI